MNIQATMYLKINYIASAISASDHGVQKELTSLESLKIVLKNHEN